MNKPNRKNIKGNEDTNFLAAIEPYKLKSVKIESACTRQKRYAKNREEHTIS